MTRFSCTALVTLMVAAGFVVSSAAQSGAAPAAPAGDEWKSASVSGSSGGPLGHRVTVTTITTEPDKLKWREQEVAMSAGATSGPVTQCEVPWTALDPGKIAVAEVEPWLAQPAEVTPGPKYWTVALVQRAPATHAAIVCGDGNSTHPADRRQTNASLKFATEAHAQQAVTELRKLAEAAESAK